VRALSGERGAWWPALEGEGAHAVDTPEGPAWLEPAPGAGGVWLQLGPGADGRLIHYPTQRTVVSAIGGTTCRT